MPEVKLQPLNITLQSTVNETIFQVVRRFGIPLASSCNGDGVCDKCRVVVLSGESNLSDMNDAELRFHSERGFGKNERMACQAIIVGNIEISTTYW